MKIYGISDLHFALEKHTAKIEGVNDLGELLVIENNEQKHLCSGEITITSIGAESR